MSSYLPPVTPAVDKWNAEQSVGAGRPWDGPGVRYNAVTVGSPYTLPTSQGPEDARALMILTGTGNVTVQQINAVGNDTVTFVGITGPAILRLATSMVTAVTGSIDNIYWLS